MLRILISASTCRPLRESIHYPSDNTGKSVQDKLNRVSQIVRLIFDKFHRLRLRSPTMRPEDLLLVVTRSMPYGKYKGRLIADLPGHYLNWFAREGFPSGEIGRLLALMQEIDHNGLKPLLEPLRLKRRT
jgi:uncharacterized protein (DUF3820 family)